MKDNYVKELMTTVKCPNCGERYQFGNVSVLGHQDELWFVSVFCEVCQNQGFVAALIKDAGAEEVIQGEVVQSRLPIGDPVSADEVLDMHEFLKDFDGNFAELFEDDED